MLHHKLKSNTGASLAMALLLFLICAVLGALVLTAGTAAAGRFSKLQEQDHAYYKVASAAEMLTQLLNGTDGKGTTVKIVRSKETTVTTVTPYTITYQLDVDGNPTAQVDYVTQGTPEITRTLDYATTIGDGAVAEGKRATSSGDADPAIAGGSAISFAAGDRSILTALALRMLFAPANEGKYYCNCDDAWAKSIQGSVYQDSAGTTFTLTPTVVPGADGLGLDSDDLTVVCTFRTVPGGEVYITVSDSVPGNAGASRYFLTLTLSAEVDEQLTEKSQTPAISQTDPDAAGTYTVTTQSSKTETKTSTVKWTVRSVA